MVFSWDLPVELARELAFRELDFELERETRPEVDGSGAEPLRSRVREGMGGDSKRAVRRFGSAAYSVKPAAANRAIASARRRSFT
jgi:hypothetical protein